MKDDSVKGRVMLAMLRTSYWRAHRFDSKATNEVESNHSTRNIGRFNKRLVAKEAETYRRIVEIAEKARQVFNARTMRYDGLKVRLLPASIYLETAEAIRHCKSQMMEALPRFLTAFPALKDEARQRLNGLYREEDYPAEKDLRDKFDIVMRVLPFPDADQFDIALPETELVTVRASIREYADESMVNAMQDLWQRLYEIVERMTKKRYDAEGAVEEARELCTLLPRLNVVGDANLEAMRQEVERRLAGQSPEALADREVRSAVAQEAAEIQAMMAGFMGLEPPAPMELSSGIGVPNVAPCVPAAGSPGGRGPALAVQAALI